MAKIDQAIIRMYRMGTGDCFIIKFASGGKEQFKMMIDCGTWQGSKQKLTPYVKDLKAFVDNHIDLLVVTHEHKDHLHGFDACKEFFTRNFTVDRVWMGWTEEDKKTKVKKWQQSYGQKKKALGLAAARLNAFVRNPKHRDQLARQFNGDNMLALQQNFSVAIDNFAELQLGITGGNYAGPLAGMKVVKEEIGKKNIEYRSPGDIIEDLENLEGIRFYVLGPPLSWDEVRVETGGKGESYDHTAELSGSDSFAMAVDKAADNLAAGGVTPFEKKFILKDRKSRAPKDYHKKDNAWRKIDFDWLQSAGNLALRLNSITNNLSLALAIEFTGSGQVLLFPGDAEYGSWASWHTIQWKVPSRQKKKHLTEDLLNRTVFYKVAHHLSHHGTAERLGLDMMTHPQLSAMATLDYSVISPGWCNTMPNRGILKDLIAKTKGRIMVMNTDRLFYDHPDDTQPLEKKIREERKKMTRGEADAFKANYLEDDRGLWMQFTVNDI
jgi:hypothetical protein